MVIFTVSFLFWIVLLLGLQTLPPTVVCIGFSALIVGLGALFGQLRLLSLAYCVAMVTLGWTLFELQARQLEHHQISQDTRVMVSIKDVPTRTPWGQRFTAEIIECLSCDKPFGPKSIQLSWYGKEINLLSGQIWEMTIRLKPYRGLRNAGSFDSSRWSMYKGYDARGYVRNKPAPKSLSVNSSFNISAARQTLLERLQQRPVANGQLGVVQALILGFKHGIDSQTWQVLRDTGTSHLLAISGLHIALFASALYWLLLKTMQLVQAVYSARVNHALCVDPFALALIGSVFGAAVYALMAGFQLPVQRAIAMLFVWAIATYRSRHLSPAWTLSFALLAVMSFNPLSVLSSGFWLSFGTVAMLFYLHRGRVVLASDEINTNNRPVSSRVQKVFPMIKTHLLLGLLLLPVTAWFFQSASVVSPLANFLAIPWVGMFVVPVSFASVLLSNVWGDAADMFLSMAQWSISVLLNFLSFLADYDRASVALSIPGTPTLICSLIGVLVLLAPRGLGFRWFSLPLLLPLFFYNSAQKSVDGFEVHTLDVGQGLATLVFAGKHTLLFDTGGRLNENVSLFDSVIVPYLTKLGRHKIDSIVVSHDDEDHAAGLVDAVDRFPDAKVYLGGDFISEITAWSHADESLPKACKAGLSWSVGDVHFSFLHPSTHSTGSDNNRSCVLLVYHGQSRVIITGDIEKQGERTIIKALRTSFEHLTRSGSMYSAENSGTSGHFPISLLVAPHHGSNSSSTPEFLAFLQPSYVIFPAGYLNRYGFPHAEVQLRYKRVGAKRYNTGLQGTVVFAFDQFGVKGEPETWWQTDRRFWHGFLDATCTEIFAEHALVYRQILLAQKGQTLCGK